MDCTWIDTFENFLWSRCLLLFTLKYGYSPFNVVYPDMCEQAGCIFTLFNTIYLQTHHNVVINSGE